LTADCSRNSATFLPPLPMMTPASLVDTSARNVSSSPAAGLGERDSGGGEAANLPK
jgi:hypothetical protein